MRIKTIQVVGLFEIFDHLVPMNLDNRITLIYGPNGFGKTTLLRLTNSLFSGAYGQWLRVPFRSAEFQFDNGDTLFIRPLTASETPNKERGLSFRLTTAGRSLKTAQILEISARDADFPLGMIEDALPLMRIGDATWRLVSTGEDLSFSDVITRYGSALPIRAQKQKIEPWLEELLTQVKVRLIESQRLVRVERHRRSEARWAQGQDPTAPAVLFYGDKVSTEIKNKLAEYAQLSQRLDQTFPRRLVEYLEKTQQETVSGVELTNKLDALNQKRERLINAGLLEKGYEPVQMPSSLQGLTQRVLPLYIEDVEHKLRVFDATLSRIELLKKIINSRFLFKSLIANERGFSFSTKNRRLLTAVNLSSGEQNYLVLLSELLFGIEPDSLILIDEPEISLHVAWQQEFLRDLAKVSQIAAVDVLIATHSPQIINENWDLTVELKGPPEEQ